MKRICKTLLLAAVIMAMLAATAFAVDYTHCADALKDLGLFKGSDKGYELDRAPTRLEAGVMLVRLLGQEENAKALADNYTAPFTDVKPWAYGYVQYLYDNGLSKGQGGGLFGSDNPCTAQQYATFLLRALGYTDSGSTPDFNYANAISYATLKGVVDDLNCDASNFLRGHMAAMGYTALSAAPKTGETDLLTKLTASGAIADAKGYDHMFDGLRFFDAVSAKTNDATAMAFKMDMDMTVSAGGETMSIEADGDVKAAVDAADMSKTQMEMNMKMQTEGETQDVTYYYANGTMYMDMDGQKVKYALPLDFMGDMTAASKSGSKTPPCMVKDIYSTTTGTFNTSTLFVSLDPVFVSSLIEDALSSSGIMDAAVNSALQSGGAAVDSEMQALVSEMIKTMKLSVDKMDVWLGLDGEEMTSMGIDMGMSLSMAGQQMSMTLKARITDLVTEGVTVTLPTDLSGYADLDTLA